jgi:hypothetical protein
MQTCCTKKKTGRKVSAFLPIVMTFLATQHWFHGLIFMMIGGYASTMMSMEYMLIFRRMMIVLTLTTVLWSVYQLYKDRFQNKKMFIMTSISSVVSVVFVIITFVKTGW